jgi:LuxR family transcriptional activator of bioluminescence operon
MIQKNSKEILTPREIECLHWSAAGKVAHEIAMLLQISERTVIFHQENAKQKLLSTTLIQAVAKAVANGWINP